jgi:hypothetical protein
MITYGALGGQLLLHWSKLGRPETTYLAGMLANAIILTCFASIYILFRSINTNDEYAAGYNLFKLALLGSVIFVLVNAFSIFQFTAFAPHTAISLYPYTGYLVFAMGGFFVGYGLDLLMVVLNKFAWFRRDAKLSVLLSRMIVLPLVGVMISLVLSYVFMSYH